MTCDLASRYIHKRLREADKKFMLPFIMNRIHFTEKRFKVVSSFMQGKGQEHWTCDCGKAELQELLESL